MNAIQLLSIALIIAVLYGIASTILYFKEKSLRTKNSAENEQHRHQIELDNARLQSEIDSERKHFADNLQQAKENYEIRRREQEESLNKQLETLRNEVKSEVAKFIKDNSDEMTKQNREKLDQLLSPLTKDLKEFRERVDVVHKDNTEARATLKSELEHIKELNKQMSEDAINLTRALKGDSKTQGDWGELTLRRMLESVGLVENINFFLQHEIRDNDYQLIRPDCIVSLPEGRDIIIDSKTSLTAYVSYTETDDKELQNKYAQEHLRSVRKHIDELGEKDYSKNFTKSLPYVVMFIPNEGAYTLAMNTDRELWNYALKKKVLMTSTTNLLGILYMISTLWQRFKQEQNAQKIVETGNAIYEKMVTFADNFLKMGAQLATVQKTYTESLNQLRDGKGNLITRFENMRTLGLTPKKRLQQLDEIPSTNLTPDTNE